MRFDTSKLFIMNNKIIFFFATFFISIPLFAKQWIIFSSQAGLEPHAFALFIKEDPSTKTLEKVGCWGFNPKDYPYISLFYGDGTISDNSAKEIGDYFIAEVTDEEWKLGLTTVNEWKNKFYGLVTNNCVDFLAALAQNLKFINLPNRRDFNTPGLYVGMLKRLNEEWHIHSKLSNDFSIAQAKKHSTDVSNSEVVNNVNSTEKAKQEIKEAAINFYKWYENVWQRGRKSETFKMVLNKFGKPVGDESACPCKVDWKAVDTYFFWMTKNAPMVSNKYLSLYKTQMVSAEKSMKAAKKFENHFAAVEEFYVPYLNFLGQLGQDVADQFGMMGFYGDRVIWDIDIQSNESAFITTTFKMPKVRWSNKTGQ